YVPTPPRSTLLPYTTLFRSGIYANDGGGMNGHAETVLEERGIEIEVNHVAKSVTPELIAWADIILTMTSSHKMLLNTQFPYGADKIFTRSEEHTSELQSRFDLVCRLLLEKENWSPLVTM